MKSILINGVSINVSDKEYEKYQKATKKPNTKAKSTTLSIPQERSKSATVTLTDYARYCESKGAKLERLTDFYTVMSGKTNGFIEITAPIKGVFNGLKQASKKFGAKWTGNFDKKQFTYTFPTKAMMYAFMVYQDNMVIPPHDLADEAKKSVYEANDKLAKVIRQVAEKINATSAEDITNAINELATK